MSYQQSLLGSLQSGLQFVRQVRKCIFAFLSL